MFRRKEAGTAQQPGVASTPVPSQRARAQAARDLTTPQTGPQKQVSSSQASVPETPSRTARINAIEAGLKARGVPLPLVLLVIPSTPGPSQPAGAGSSRGLTTAQPNLQKQVPPSQSSLQDTPSGRVRLEAIESGLRARSETHTPVPTGPLNIQQAATGPSSSSPSDLRTEEAPVSPFPSSQASSEID